MVLVIGFIFHFLAPKRALLITLQREYPMIHTKVACLILGLLTTYVGMAQECMVPDTPKTPIGSSATLEEMIAAQDEVKSFQAANSEYLNCIDQKMIAEKKLVATDSAAEERYALAAADYNAAISREEKVAEDFNRAIKAYKSANRK